MANLSNKRVKIIDWAILDLKKFRLDAFAKILEKFPKAIQTTNDLEEPSEQDKLIANIINVVSSANTERIYNLPESRSLGGRFISFYKEAEQKRYGKKFISYYINHVIFKRIATISPFIIFPILAFYFHNWWLLLGIIFAILGGFLSVFPIFLLLAFVISIVYLLKYGFQYNSYVNIMLLDYLYGHIAFSLSRHFEIKAEKTKVQMDEDISKLVEEYIRKKDLHN